jgi:transcriptional regulator with XRE-family HTH domain
MSKTSMETLAANLALLRKLPGMPGSQTAIAKRGGLDQTTVSRTLRAVNAISIDKLDGLAKAFSVKPWHLLSPGLSAQVNGLSPKALALALAYEGLGQAKRAHLYATSVMLQNPDAEEVSPDGTGQEPPVEAPNPVRRPSRHR